MIIEAIKQLRIINPFYDKILRILNFLKVQSYFRKLIISLWNIRYYINMISFYSPFIKRGDLCFDIGASVGDKTRIFLKLGARVICVEPLKICVKMLYESFGHNKNVIIVGKAIGEKDGYGVLSICDDYYTLSTLSNKWMTDGKYATKFSWTRTQRVKITTLDNLIKLYGLPRFCKIDVEGFEENVLKGLTQKISYLCFEFHKELFDEMKKCIEHLSSLGSLEFNFVLGEGAKLYLSEWISSDKLFEVLNSIKEEYLWGDIFVKFI